MFNWFKKKDLDKYKDKEIWHYICENGHKWKSLKSPRGNLFGGRNIEGELCTRCKECGTEVTMGNIYINGKKTQMGAIHVGFRQTRKNKRAKTIKND